MNNISDTFPNRPEIPATSSRPTLPLDGPLKTRSRLTARPRPWAECSDDVPSGYSPLHLGEDRDAYIYIPPLLRQPAPLLVLLHSEGGSGLGILSPFKALADEYGMILLAPESRHRTWDIVRGGFGDDLDFIDQALGKVFAEYAVRTSRIALGGFSDGASYALSVGIPNANLFTHLISFSPGFVTPFEIEAPTKIFIAHGTEDQVLPIERCGRRIARHLMRTGFEMNAVEFVGGHGIPDEIAREAVKWFIR